MVYIDDAFLPFRGMRMSHMVADSSEDLLAMVDKIGVLRKWIQFPGTPREHFDICASKRLLAIKNGAIAVSLIKLAQMRKKRMKDDTRTGSNGKLNYLEIQT